MGRGFFGGGRPNGEHESEESMSDQTLIEKIHRLSPERVEEVKDFVDFLKTREPDRALVHAAGRLSEDAFRTVWDNPDDAEYDRL